MKLVILSLLVIAICCKNTSEQVAARPSVNYVNMTLFQGLWYELAHLPLNYWEYNCYCTEFTYTLNASQGTDFGIVRQCRKGNSYGAWKFDNGTANILNTTSNAEFHFNMEATESGNYVVIYMDPNYEFGLIGSENKNYAFMIARDNIFNYTTFNTLNASATAAGFKTLTWSYPYQGLACNYNSTDFDNIEGHKVKVAA
jgi:apolipoprotein D and lipocalin family protein